jgi:hypothetical protein
MHLMRVVTEFRCFIVLALWLAWRAAFPPTVNAQASRADLIAQEQSAKAEHLGTEGPTKLEKSVVWAEHLPLFSLRSGLYPWVGNIYPGTGSAAGVGYVRRLARESDVNFGAGVAIRGSSFFTISANMPEIAGGLITTAVDAHHAVAKDLDFYGLGPNSSLDDPLQYNYRPTTVSVAATLNAIRYLELSARYEWLTFKSEGRAPEPPTVAPGIGENLSYHVVQATAIIDWRRSSNYVAPGRTHRALWTRVAYANANRKWWTSPGYATRGGSHRVTWSQYFETKNRPFEFHQLEYEGVQLLPILREQWVLAARVLATFTFVENGNEVPVVLTPTLGDAETLRGYKERRFTDLDRLVLTGEYRWRPSRFLDMAVFFDAGKVGAERKDLGLSNLETDWGLGARFHTRTFTVLRLEVAKSHEGWKFIFTGKKPF